MGMYRGISSEKIKNVVNIYVRFKHNSKDYGKRNFTTLFGIKTQKKAHEKLQECKTMLSQGKNPFLISPNTLNELFYERIESKSRIGGWSEHTISGYVLYYEKVLKKPLGKKKLSKISYDDLDKIQKKHDLENKSIEWKKRMKQILNPIFEEALRKKEVIENPCLLIKLEPNILLDAKKKNNGIEFKSKFSILELSQILYKAIPYYPVKTESERLEKESFLYFVLLTAKRFGEVLKLKKSDCFMDLKYIVSQPEITKTDIKVQFVMPHEVFEYINSIEDKDSLLFPNIKHKSVYLTFQRLLKVAREKIESGDIQTSRSNAFIKNRIQKKTDEEKEILAKKSDEERKELAEAEENKREKLINDNEILTIHDTRALMLNIMITNKNIDSNLADACIDHRTKGTLGDYVSFSFEQTKEVFELYWGLVRQDEEFIKKEEFRKNFYKFFELEFERAWQKEQEKNEQLELIKKLEELKKA